RPRQPAFEPHLLDDALVVMPRHEAFERRERTAREHVQVGELARGQRDLLEPVDAVGARAGAVDQLPAVRRDQRLRLGEAHAATTAGTRPSSSSFAKTSAAHSSALCSSVSTTSYVFVGSAEGSITPV